MRFIASVILFALASLAQADERGFRFTTSGSLLPAMRSIVIVRTGEPGPGASKHQALASTAGYKETAKVTTAGPFDIWWQPKVGIAVRVLTDIKLREGEVKEIRIDDHLGVVSIRGDQQPRPMLVTLTKQDDPGPDEKGHLALQTAKEYRVGMVVPAGFYAAWVTPDNGARAKKINERFRVDAGKSITLD